MLNTAPRSTEGSNEPSRPLIAAALRGPSQPSRSRVGTRTRRRAIVSMIAAAGLAVVVSGCGTDPEMAQDSRAGLENGIHLATMADAAPATPWAALSAKQAASSSGILIGSALLNRNLATEDFFLTTRRFDGAAMNPLRFTTPMEIQRAQSIELRSTPDTTAAATAWPVDGAAVLAAMPGEQLFKMPDLFDSCPTSPDSAKGMAHSMRARGAGQAVLADLYPNAGSPTNVASLGALFQMHSASGRDFVSRLAMNLAVPMPTAQPSRLAAGIFSLDAFIQANEGGTSQPAANARSSASRFVSLGVRNKNPGNLRDRDTGNFAQFDTLRQGIHAADMNLLDYQVHHGIRTIEAVVNRWAPKGDGNNDPAAYAAAVSKSTGIGVDEQIDLTDATVRTRVLSAMFDVESPGWRQAALQESGHVMASAGAIRRSGRRGAQGVRTEARAQVGAEG